MKKLNFIPVLRIVLASCFLILAACNKTSDSLYSGLKPTQSLKSEKCMTVAEAHALGIYDDSSQDTEEDLKIDDSPILNLNTRSATMSISSITTDTLSFDDEDDNYGNKLCGKNRGLPRIQSGDTYFRIRGSGFGIAKGSSSLVMTFNAKNYTLTDFQQLVQNGPIWTDTLLYVGIRDASPNLTSALVNELKYGTVKFTLTKGSEVVSKSIKAVSDWRDGNNTFCPYSSAISFGQAFWNVANERHKMGKPSLNFINTYNQNSLEGKDGYYRKINTYYVPQVGDMVFRAYSVSHYNAVNAGDSDWNPEYEPINNVGVVMVVGAESKGVRDVTIWEMNMKCTGAIQKKKYKYLYGLFIPKSGEAPFYGYGR